MSIEFPKSENYLIMLQFQQWENYFSHNKKQTPSRVKAQVKHYYSPSKTSPNQAIETSSSCAWMYRRNSPVTMSNKYIHVGCAILDTLRSVYTHLIKPTFPIICTGYSLFWCSIKRTGAATEDDCLMNKAYISHLAINDVFVDCIIIIIIII